MYIGEEEKSRATLGVGNSMWGEGGGPSFGRVGDVEIHGLVFLGYTPY